MAVIEAQRDALDPAYAGAMESLVTVACSGVSSGCACESCVATRDAAAKGARPPGVPLRVYGGYLEARSAIRTNAPALASETLEWVLGYLAEERGVSRGLSLAAKLAALREKDVISPRLRPALIARALSDEGDPMGRAWALMSIAEHAFQRLYL